jgi:hypothetical protein
MKTVYLSEIYYHTKHQDSILSDASVALASEVRTIAMLVLVVVEK